MKNSYLASENAFLLKMGKNIRAAREKLGISQENLAHLCELDRAYMGRVERGEKNISILNLKKICNTLKIKLSDLFNG